MEVILKNKFINMMLFTFYILNIFLIYGCVCIDCASYGYWLYRPYFTPNNLILVGLNGEIYTLNKDTGQILSQAFIPQINPGDFIISSPAGENNDIYIVSHDQMLFKFSPDGNTIWSFNIHENYKKDCTWKRILVSLQSIIVTSLYHDCGIIGVDKTTPSIIWSREGDYKEAGVIVTGTDIYSFDTGEKTLLKITDTGEILLTKVLSTNYYPALLSLQQDTLWIGLSNDWYGRDGKYFLIGVSPADLTEKMTTSEFNNHSDILFYNGYIFHFDKLNDYEDPLTLIKRSFPDLDILFKITSLGDAEMIGIKDNMIFIVRHDYNSISAYDTTSGSLIWKHEVPDRIYQTALEDGLYLVNTKRIYKLDNKTGNEIWCTEVNLPDPNPSGGCYAIWDKKGQDNACKP